MLKIVVAILALVPSLSWACSCADYSSTLKGVLGRTNVESVVVMVENTQVLSHGVKAKVVEVLHGTLDKTEISIWGDPGHLCRGPFVNGVGRKWIAVVSKLTEPHQGEAVGDFETMSCMASSLKVEGDSVVGRIIGHVADAKMTLEDFKSTLKSPKDYLEPQILCQVHTSYRYFDDHVDFYNKVEKEVILTNNHSGSVVIDFVAKSEEDKDFKGRVEGVVTRDFPDQIFSTTKIKGQITVPDLLKPMNLDQSLQWPINIYSQFVAGKYAQNTMSCSADAKLK